MRKSGEKHSKGKRAKRNSFFAVIFMLIIFSFCSCGETTETTPSDLEKEIPEEETEAENFSEDKQVYSEDDEHEDPIITGSQTNNASITSESAEMPRGSEGGNVEEPAEVFAGTDYILNMNTKKFHYPDCSSVGQMAEKNKWAYTGNRDDVIAMGYVPCKRCNP